METLLKDPSKFYSPKNRPSGHDIAAAFGKRNAGAIPANLLKIPNTESNSAYMRYCQQKTAAVGSIRLFNREPPAQAALREWMDCGSTVEKGW